MEGNDSSNPNDVSEMYSSNGLDSGDTKHVYQPLDTNAVVHEVYEAPQPDTTQELYQPLGATSPIELYEIPMDSNQAQQYNDSKSPSNLGLVGGSAPTVSLPQGDLEIMPKMSCWKSLRVIDYFFLVLLFLAVSLAALAFSMSIAALAR